MLSAEVLCAIREEYWMRLVVMGQGYVGLPLALRACQVGYEVYGVEKDKSRLEMLKMGQSYIADILSEELEQNLNLNYFPVSPEEIPSYDVAVITVPTPLKEGVPDLSFVIDAVDMLGNSLRIGALVILESTTYPGTTEEIICPRLEQVSGLVAGVDFYVGYSPERIDPGNKKWKINNTPKIVSGINAESLKRVSSFYSDLVETIVPVKGTREAELAKLLENTFRQVNIALVNEVAMSARLLNVDIWESINAAATKPFGFMPFYPGPGVGGHCLPIDPVYLSWRISTSVKQNVRLIELANEINANMPSYVVLRIADILNDSGKSLKGSSVLCYGITYKPDTSDLRESPSYEIVLKLINKGVKVTVVDPFVNHLELDSTVELAEEENLKPEDFDLCVILTNHSCFNYINLLNKARRILDVRHVIKGPNVSYL